MKISISTGQDHWNQSMDWMQLWTGHNWLCNWVELVFCSCSPVSQDLPIPQYMMLFSPHSLSHPAGPLHASLGITLLTTQFAHHLSSWSSDMNTYSDVPSLQSPLSVKEPKWATLDSQHYHAKWWLSMISGCHPYGLQQALAPYLLLFGSETWWQGFSRVQGCGGNICRI